MNQPAESSAPGDRPASLHGQRLEYVPSPEIWQHMQPDAPRGRYVSELLSQEQRLWPTWHGGNALVVPLADYEHCQQSVQQLKMQSINATYLSVYQLYYLKSLSQIVPEHLLRGAPGAVLASGIAMACGAFKTDRNPPATLVGQQLRDIVEMMAQHGAFTLSAHTYVEPLGCGVWMALRMVLRGGAMSPIEQPPMSFMALNWLINRAVTTQRGLVSIRIDGSVSQSWGWGDMQPKDRHVLLDQPTMKIATYTAS